jgi:type IV fimbrial biogenesis protein FimT
MNYKGFTLIELMTSLSILAILIFIGLPSFASQVQKNRVRVAALSLLDAIELSRTNAVSILITMVYSAKMNNSLNNKMQ